MVWLVLKSHHGSLKVVEFMMELLYWNLEEDEASVEASLHGLLHPYHPISGQFHKRN